MNEDEMANILSLIIPLFFFVLWILIAVAVIWAIVLFVKRQKHKKNN